jgi:hypothetical protein
MYNNYNLLLIGVIMVSVVNIFSNEKNVINKFLSKFYNANLLIENSLSWEKEFPNPVEMAELVGTFADNIDKYNLSMWICLDSNIFINVSDRNANEIIKYLYERYPY